MISTKQTKLPPKLRTVQRRFEKWRASRPRLTRIPDSLWQAAISLYPRLSLNQISRILHLENTALRQHLGPSALHASDTVGGQRFMELQASAGTEIGEYLLEVQEAGGRVLRVRLPGSRGVEGVVELIRLLSQESS